MSDLPDSAVAPDRSIASIAALVLANIVPLVGVLFFGWQVFPIILVYWLENVVVGGFNVLKMLSADPGQPIAWVSKLFLIPFFCVHFGMFTLIHGVFVFALFGQGVPSLHQFHSGWLSVAQVMTAIHATHIEYAMLALLLSHGFSFVWNYLLGGEYKNVQLQLLMRQPYARIVILHLVVLGGAFLVAALGSPLPALVLLVALKTGVDVAAHRRERAKLGTPAPPRPALTA